MSIESIAHSGYEQEIILPNAQRYFFEDSTHQEMMADHLSRGEVGAIPFSGKSIFGLFTASHIEEGSHRISDIKSRPRNQSHVLVSIPEYLEEHVDTAALLHDLDDLIELQNRMFAIGLILPASKHADRHLVSDNGTLVNIWGQGQEFRSIVEKYRAMSPQNRALAGTSANRNGQPTHNNSHEMWTDLRDDVHFIAHPKVPFHGPDHRRRSTTIIDVTTPQPTMFRLGSVSPDEVNSALVEHNLPSLFIPNEFKIVSQRH